MAIKTCPNGHHYNPEDNPTCPYCERVSNGGLSWLETDADFNTVDIRYSGNQNMVNNAQVPGRPGAPADGYDLDRTEILPETGPEPSEYIPQNEPVIKKAEEDNDKYKDLPVVGWVVCIEGPDKGKDFCLHGAKNTIGRRNGSSVQLSDPKISRDGFPALIVYDNKKSHKFYLASGDASSHNNVELGGSMLLGQSVINPYDEIHIEDTVLIFVPFCSDEFFWE